MPWKSRRYENVRDIEISVGLKHKVDATQNKPRKVFQNNERNFNLFHVSFSRSVIHYCGNLIIFFELKNSLLKLVVSHDPN